jgi:hypothetical protein
MEKISIRHICLLFFSPILAAIILVCSASPLIAQQTPTTTSTSRSPVILDIRDSTTGYSVPANVTFTNPNSGQSAPISAQTNSLGHLQTALPPSRYVMRVTSPGYDPMQSTWDTAISDKLKIMLISKTPPQELLPEVVNPQLREGYLLVHGYVVDAGTGKLLNIVRVRIEKYGTDTLTNDRGYFSQSLRLAYGEQGFEDDMSLELSGYKKLILGNQLFGAPEMVFPLELQPGSGVDRRDNTHPTRRDPDARVSHGSLLRRGMGAAVNQRDAPS